MELKAIAHVSKVTSQGSLVLVECPALSEVRALVEKTVEVAAIASRHWFDRVLLTWPGCPNPLHITASFAHSKVELPRSEFFIPELELHWSEFYYGEKPIYINSRDNKVLFSNQAGLTAQQKSLSQFVGESVHLLNKAEELSRRVNLIFNNELEGRLYEYEAFRWIKLGTEYRRKTMNFASYFGKIQWCGEECWYSAPQEAIEKGAII